MGVNHPTGGGLKCGYHTHTFHIKPRVNLGAKVCSSQTELRAFVKATSFFCSFMNSFLVHVHKFDLLIVPYHHNYLSRLSQSTHHHAFSLLVVTGGLGGGLRRVSSKEGSIRSGRLVSSPCWAASWGSSSR